MHATKTCFVCQDIKVHGRLLRDVLLCYCYLKHEVQKTRVRLHLHTSVSVTCMKDNNG